MSLTDPIESWESEGGRSVTPSVSKGSENAGEDHCQDDHEDDQRSQDLGNLSDDANVFILESEGDDGESDAGEEKAEAEEAKSESGSVEWEKLKTPGATPGDSQPASPAAAANGVFAVWGNVKDDISEADTEAYWNEFFETRRRCQTETTAEKVEEVPSEEEQPALENNNMMASIIVEAKPTAAVAPEVDRKFGEAAVAARRARAEQARKDQEEKRREVQEVRRSRAERRAKSSTISDAVPGDSAERRSCSPRDFRPSKRQTARELRRKNRETYHRLLAEDRQKKKEAELEQHQKKLNEKLRVKAKVDHYDAEYNLLEEKDVDNVNLLRAQACFVAYQGDVKGVSREEMKEFQEGMFPFVPAAESLLLGHAGKDDQEAACTLILRNLSEQEQPWPQDTMFRLVCGDGSGVLGAGDAGTAQLGAVGHKEFVGVQLCFSAGTTAGGHAKPGAFSYWSLCSGEKCFGPLYAVGRANGEPKEVVKKE